jgi:hypothetical protein
LEERAANQSILRLLAKKRVFVEELHMEIDGRIRKTKPISSEDPKRQTEIERERAS